MANTPLTLAALATSAVPGLIALGARKHGFNGDGDYTAVVVTTDAGDVLVRVPANDRANNLLSAQMFSLQALTAGLRAQLSFTVPEVLGVTRAGDWRAVVSTFVPGEKILVTDLTQDSLLTASIAGALEALHTLPPSFIAQAGLAYLTANDCRIAAARVVDQANSTGLLPVTVKERWVSVLRDLELWNFAPTVVHGSVSDDVILIADNAVSGLLGFENLHFGDPAVDFAWLCAAGHDVLMEVLKRYCQTADGVLDKLAARAHFYHELEVAKWLLHGIQTHNQEIIDDAVQMLDALTDKSNQYLIFAAADPISADLVSDLLEHTPQDTQLNSNSLSQTAAFDSLDDERVFNADTDFIDPLPADNHNQSTDQTTGNANIQ